MSFNRFVTAVLLLVLVQCQQTDTQSMLDLNITAIDRTPPVPLLPIKGATTSGLSVQLFWSPRTGSSQYIVEVSASSDFANPVSGSPFTVSGTSLAVTLPDAVTYWWRVKTALMQGDPLVASFEALDDSVYVFCAESTACSDTGRVGNKILPFQTLRTAIGTAKILGKSVKVAARGASADPYIESISLAAGVNMKGGYNSTFIEAQNNAATNVTAISSSAVPVTASLITTATVFEGFRVVGAQGFALYIDQSNQNLTIRNNTILSGSVITGNSQAVYCSQSYALITGNTITGGSASNPTSSGQGIGINLQNCSGRITGNTITGGVSYGASSVGMLIANESNPTVDNNVIAGGNPLNVGTSIGINLITGSDGHFINNTIMGGISASGISNGIIINGSSTPNAVAPVIENNIIFTLGGVSSRFCINETGTAGFSNPASLRNNLLFNCANALYRNVDGGPTSITAIANVNDALQSIANPNTGAVVVSGNVTVSGGQNPFVNLGTRNFRLQNNGGAMTAQEWLNVAYGGLDMSASAYGSLTADRDSATRSATAAGANNTGATGYSLGAYEF